MLTAFRMRPTRPSRNLIPLVTARYRRRRLCSASRNIISATTPRPRVTGFSVDFNSGPHRHDEGRRDGPWPGKRHRRRSGAVLGGAFGRPLGDSKDYAVRCESLAFQSWLTGEE